MAQGLDLKSWDDQKSPGTDGKMRLTSILKRSRSSTGSRRIFPPQFKLRVLDSYRNDLDCRGNQRATARKYNIHRRQIQKWLQCEQNLRSSVEESSKRGDWSAASGNEKARKTTDPFKTGLGGSVGGGKVDGATLNRSAVIYARLSDAERSRDESSLRPPTLNPDAAADVYDRRDSSSSSPSSSSCSSSSSTSSTTAAALNLKRVAQKLYPSTSCVSRGWSPPRFVDSSKLYETARLRLVDDNFNRVPPAHYPDDTLCRDKVTFPHEPDSGLAVGPSPVACETVRTPPCRMERTEPDSPSDIAPAPPPKTPTSLRSEDEGEEYAGEDAKKAADSRLKAVKDSDESKSFSPKRKWMQESMQESAVRATYTTLPIKQRVKMNLKSAATSSSPLSSEETSTTPTPKGVSPNFTIEKLCGNDIKTETVTPPSIHSPSADAECYSNWRPTGSEPCSGYSGYSLPFPPPLLFSHRVIPDLVSLHFKPESLRDGATPLVGSSFPTERRRRSSSTESLDVSLKEERVTDDDEESADVDILSTTPVEKKSFDFGGYNFGKRRSFSVQFKLTVLDAFYNDKDCNKNQRATARKFNINRRQVQKWLSQESDLRTEGSIKNGKYLQRQRLGSERDTAGTATSAEETCKQCPQHCSSGSGSGGVQTKEEEEKGSEEGSRAEETIEVNVKHCTDKECLTRERASGPGGGRTFAEEEEEDLYRKGFYPSDLKSAGVYEPQYLFPTEAPGMMVSGHGAFFGWPAFNASALQVPNFHFMASWYHHHHHHHSQLGSQHHGFGEYCQEKSKIY